MRIVYLLTSLGIGGAERLTLALAERMRERGHSVLIVTLRPRLERECPTSLPVFRLGMRRNPLSVFAAFLRARRSLGDLHSDILHGHGFHGNLLARLLKPFVSAPAVVSTIHNVYEGRRLRMLAYRLTDPLCDRVTAVSQAVAGRFVALGAVSARKCTVIPNAIDVAEFTPEPARRMQTRAASEVNAGFIWLAAGRLTPAKDYPNLLRAFAQLCAQQRNTQQPGARQPEAQLWIAGQGTDAQRTALQSLAAQLGVDGMVRWLGLHGDMPALFDAADAFVLSSAWEGMPLVLAEAMAMEKPVVATDVGGVRELVAEAGRIVAPHDAAQLAQAMQAVMLESEAARQAQGQAARQRIEQNFSMAARAAEYESLYTSFYKPEA